MRSRRRGSRCCATGSGSRAPRDPEGDLGTREPTCRDHRRLPTGPTATHGRRVGGALRTDDRRCARLAARPSRVPRRRSAPEIGRGLGSPSLLRRSDQLRRPRWRQALVGQLCMVLARRGSPRRRGRHHRDPSGSAGRTRDAQDRGWPGARYRLRRSLSCAHASGLGQRDVHLLRDAAFQRRSCGGRVVSGTRGSQRRRSPGGAGLAVRTGVVRAPCRHGLDEVVRQAGSRDLPATWPDWPHLGPRRGRHPLLIAL